MFVTAKLEMPPKECSGASGNYDRGITSVIGQSHFMLVLGLTFSTIGLMRMRMTLELPGTYERVPPRIIETRGPI